MTEYTPAQQARFERVLQHRAKAAERDELARLARARGNLAVAAWQVGRVHAAAIRASRHDDGASDLIEASDGGTQRWRLTSTFPDDLDTYHDGLTATTTSTATTAASSTERSSR